MKKEESYYYSIGEFFVFYNVKYLLAQIRPKEVCLIGLSAGNRYSEPIIVKDIYKITEKEFERITDGSNSIDWCKIRGARDEKNISKHCDCELS